MCLDVNYILRTAIVSTHVILDTVVVMKDTVQTWDEETLFTSGDEYFSGLLRAIDGSKHIVEFETYIYEKGVMGDRLAEHLIAAARRGVRVRIIVDGWGSPNFHDEYWPKFRAEGVRVRFFRVPPWVMKRVPGDPKSLRHRIVYRWSRANRGNHRKFCLIDHHELWAGSFNVSDVHLRSVVGNDAWKDVAVRVTGKDVKYAQRAFQRAFRGWTALNWPARSPRLLLLNDSFFHKRRTRLNFMRRLRKAKSRIWIATPYFVPVGRVFRALARQAKKGVDVRLIIPEKNDVWIMEWVSVPLMRQLAKKGVKFYIYKPRFAHQKLLIADDWICVGSTNLNHRSFLHDLELDVVVTHEHNKQRMIEGYLRDQSLSDPFDSSLFAKLPLWKRILSSVFTWTKYWS